ncbi:MAG TPA: helix-turn-helix domain-containing protein, partial [Polyangiaceae bacterium]
SDTVAAAAAAPLTSLELSRGESDAVERGKIEEALRRCAGNQRRAAALLGVSPRTMLNLRKKHGIPGPHGLDG